MLSYLEVWNNMIRMKQNNSQFKEKKTLWAACTVQPLKRVSDSFTCIGTSVASEDSEVVLSLYKLVTGDHLRSCLQLW